MADGCFLILCGIPASGKSTLARDLIEKDWKIAGKYVHFVYVDYDEFIPENLPVNDVTLSAKWKNRRREIINSLENWFSPKQGIGLESDIFISPQSTFVSNWCSCCNNHFIRSNEILHVVVVDDNMFYRSMRYEYYQLARKTSLGFAQIYLHCPLKLALCRNAERPAQVNEDTIIKMSNRIEKPDPEKFSWEKFSVTITSTSPQSYDTWETIIKLLENAAVTPVPALKISDDMQKEKDRTITMKSIIHQADQVIRKLISTKLEELKVQKNPSDILKQEASSLNQRRKRAMELIKKEPRQIIHHVFNHKSFRLDDHSKRGTGNPPESSMSKTKESNESWEGNAKNFSSEYENENSCLSYDQRMMDETLENFWEIVSAEEFNNIVRNVFGQC